MFERADFLAISTLGGCHSIPKNCFVTVLTLGEGVVVLKELDF